MGVEEQPLQIHGMNNGYNDVQARAIGLNAAFIAFIAIVMGIRMYARLAIAKAVGLDDVADILPQNWEPMLLSIWTTRLLYSSAMMFVKLALLILYLRLDDRPTMRWTVYILMFLVVGLTVAGLIVSIIGCYPPEVFWKAMENPERYASNCINQGVQQAFWDAAGVIVILTDICVWACPLPMVWKLHLPMRQKWAVSGVFALGIFSVAAGCVRFYYVRRLANEPEIYFYIADSLNWCAMELYVAIFCGCSSALKTFLKRHFPSLLGSRGSQRQYQLGSHGPEGTSANNAHPLSSLSSHQRGHKATFSSNAHEDFDMGTRTESRNDSEEAIIPNTGDNMVAMKAEVQQQARGNSGDSDGRMHV